MKFLPSNYTPLFFSAILIRDFAKNRKTSFWRRFWGFFFVRIFFKELIWVGKMRCRFRNSKSIWWCLLYSFRMTQVYEVPGMCACGACEYGKVRRGAYTALCVVIFHGMRQTETYLQIIDLMDNLNHVIEATYSKINTRVCIFERVHVPLY